MPITREEILAALGPTDDDVIAEVVAIDPSPEELIQARTWLDADEALVNEGRPLASGKVGRLIEILSPPGEEDELR